MTNKKVGYHAKLRADPRMIDESAMVFDTSSRVSGESKREAHISFKIIP